MTNKIHEQLALALVALQQVKDTDRWLEIEEALRSLKEDPAVIKSEDELYVCNHTILALFMGRAAVDGVLMAEATFFIQKLLKGEPIVTWEYQVYQIYSPEEDEECSTECRSSWRKPFPTLEEAIECLNATAFTGYVQKWQKDPFTGESSSSLAGCGDIVYRKKEGIPRYMQGRRKTMEIILQGKVFDYQGKTWRVLKIDVENPRITCEDFTPLVECEDVESSSRESFPIRTVRRRLHLNEWGQPMCVLTEPKSISTELWNRYQEELKTEIEAKPHTFTYAIGKGQCLVPVTLT